MGRGVMTLSGADAIAYDYLEPDEEYYRELWDDPGEDWSHYSSFEDMMYASWDEDFADTWHWYWVGIQDRAKELFPSMEPTDYWIGNEVHVIAENAHSIITISEYMGVVSVCLGAKYDRGDYYAEPEGSIRNIGSHWRAQVSDKFTEAFGSLRKLGTASNGESFFEKVS